jgi:outer membrane immunogenic protein
VIKTCTYIYWGTILKTLKLALLGATFLAGASAFSGAYAADVYARGGSIKDTGPVDYAPAITWTGFYVGAHAGGAFGDTIEFSVPGASVENDVDNTWLAGVHVGYNWQTARNFVLGIEGSLGVLGEDRGVEFDGEDLGELSDDWLASIRGRVGYASGATLLYGTGGIAFLSGDHEPFDDTFTGWVAGAGVEHKFRDNLSFGVEGLYYSFEDEFNGVDLERDFFTVQARLTYHLGDRHSDPLK